MIEDHDDPVEVDDFDEFDDEADEFDDEADEFDDEADEFDDEVTEDDPDEKTANVGETSVEFNVEELIAEIEADSGVSHVHSNEDPRKRLERILEERRAARELKEIDGFLLDTLD